MFGKNLKSYRLRKQMSKKELAIKVNVTPMAITNYQASFPIPRRVLHETHTSMITGFHSPTALLGSYSTVRFLPLCTSSCFFRHIKNQYPIGSRVLSKYRPPSGYHFKRCGRPPRLWQRTMTQWTVACGFHGAGCSRFLFRLVV